MPCSELKRILYVEDEPDIRIVAQMALESLGGFTLQICEDGFQAVEKGPAFAPQLILLDVMMPGMNGPDTLKALREFEQLETVPVIFMTAKVQPAEIEAYLQMGAAGVIAKPFDPMTLGDEIREIWSQQI